MISKKILYFIVLAVLFFIIIVVFKKWILEIRMDKSIKNRNQKVEKYLDMQISKSNIPGIQYIVMNSNSYIFEYTDGLADIKKQEVMNPEITMMVYSMTKTITAAGVLQLIEKGTLNLDEKIDKYIKNNPYNKDITIRHLLSQTSGIPNPIPLRWAHLVENHVTFDEDSEFDKVLKKHSKSSFNPGKKYAYSNISYWYLGKIIEKVSRMSYQDYIKKYVLIPLQLTQNEVSCTIPNYTNHAKGYLKKYSFLGLLKGFLMDKELVGESEGKWIYIKNLYLNGVSFGGLIGSARSFSKFLQDQLREKSVLFNEKTKKLYYSQQKNNTGELVEMTLGWHVGDLEGIKYFFKEGGGAGYHSEMRIYPKQKIATIIIVNKTNFNSKKCLNMLDNEFL